MRVDKHKKRQVTGLANYEKRVRKVGLENIKKVGHESAMKRKTFRGGCNDKEFATRIGSRGGRISRRSRKITLNDNLHDDEWGVLCKAVNTVLGQFRLEGQCNAVDQTKIRSVELQNAWGRKDWIWVMNNALNNPRWRPRLGIHLLTLAKEYQLKIKKGETLSAEETNDFRIIRNLNTAWGVAGKALYQWENQEEN